MILSGKPSTTTPVKNGSNGEDANLTYYWSSDSVLGSHYFDIVKIDGTAISPAIRISKIYGNSVTPRVNDHVIYSVDNRTRDFVIVTYNSSTSEAEVNTIGEWSREEIEPTPEIDIDINISFVNDSLREYKENNQQGASTDIQKRETSSSIFLLTDVTSNNGQPLGRTKITLEFYTDNISPEMDSIIPNFFDKINSTDEREFDYRSQDKIELCKSYRGYTAAYSSNDKTYVNLSTEETILRDFDSEKLDNFVIVVKDFDEDIYEETHRSKITINKKLLTQNVFDYITWDEDNVPTPHFLTYQYKCYAFIYVTNEAKDYEKHLIGEVDLNNL